MHVEGQLRADRKVLLNCLNLLGEVCARRGRKLGPLLVVEVSRFYG